LSIINKNLKKYLFIINPTAGKVNADKIVPLIKNISSGYPVEIEIVITEYHKHAIKIAGEAIENSFVISVGGDGTLNEIINGINSEKNITVGLLPSGTGNDFKNNIILSNSIEENLNYFFTDNVKTQLVDIGSLSYKIADDPKIYNHTRFINSLGVGFDAYAAHLNQSNKKLSGLPSYIISVLRALLNYKSIDVNFEFEGKTITGNKLLLTIGNGKTTGGGFYLTKDAKIDDGILDVCIVDFVSRIKLLSKIPAAIKQRLETVPEVTALKLKSAKIKLQKPYYVHVDGEIISDIVSELEISIDKNKLKIITF
jgi:YegS/Rv2252/BmrU family lipid kinase